VFPGSFDPLTVAHVAIAEAAVAQCGLDRLDLVISRVALAKEGGGHSPLEARVAAIEALGQPWLGVAVTDRRLIADIADGYDVCVMGADKWHQLFDVSFYESAAARDGALARLPALAVAPRVGVAPPSGVVLLEIAVEHQQVSSTAVRAGRHDWRA
jgi:hypothetical protein